MREARQLPMLAARTSPAESKPGCVDQRGHGFAAEDGNVGGQVGTGSDWRCGLMEVIACSKSVQLADGSVAFNPFYDAIQYSSVWENSNPGYFYGRGRLDSPQAWSARENTPEQWFQVADSDFALYAVGFRVRYLDSRLYFQVQMDISKVGWISGVVVQGRQCGPEQWVTSFKVSASADLSAWVWVESGRVFEGNSDPNTKVVALFNGPIEARYVRIHPNTWLESLILLCNTKFQLTYTLTRLNHISMRAGVLLSASARAGVPGA